MSLELYKDLDCEFDRLLADIQSRLGQFPAQMTASAQSARSGIDQIDSSIKECADTMRQIELELKGLDAATRKSLNDVFTEKKRRFGDLKQQADEKRAQVQREELMTSKGRAAHAMQTNMNKLDRQNKVLEDVQRRVAEMEEDTGTIMDELAHNRTAITSAHAKTKEVIADTQVAHKTIHEMQKRENCIIS